MSIKFYIKLSLGFILLLVNENLKILDNYLLILLVFAFILYLFIDEVNIKKTKSERLLYEYQEKMFQINKQSNLRYKQLETIVSNINFPLALLDNRAFFLLSNENFLRMNEISSILELKEDSPLNNDIKAFMRESYLKENNLQRSLSINGQDYNALSITIYENNRFVGTLFIFQNITSILERERIQKRFIADASHELKTPVSAIKGMIEILNRPDFNDEETLLDFHKQIELESKRMENIINDMLNLSRFSSKNVLLDMSTFNLFDLVNDVNRSYNTLIKEKRLKFINEIDPTLMLFADKDKFFHIISNLISNAIKSSDKGEIRIYSNKTSVKLEIMIKDNGYGINQEEIPYIFDRYYRVDESRSRQTGGSGLGLAIVKAYVIAHKGQVDVKSTLNVGSTFILLFPISIVKNN
jgi:two-component system, OmpR family, phosphate regulon sensor histidine kinase PhoR